MTSRFRFLLLAFAIIAAACGRESPFVFPSTPDGGQPPRISFDDPPAEELPTSPEAPAPAPVPPTEISIVGSTGTGAFVPNPLAAAAGAMLVWKNDDAVPHRIMLSDGTDLGIIAPGQTSAPTAMSASTVSYHCTFHPTMTGIISDPSVTAPPPPEPPPIYEPPVDRYPDDDY
jgi:plastocyanin